MTQGFFLYKKKLAEAYLQTHGWYMEPLLSEEVKGYVNFGNIIRAAAPLGEVNLTHL